MVWAVLLAVALGWQAATLAVAHLPTIADVLRALRRHRLGRWALLLAWAWVGWHLFARTTL